MTASRKGLTFEDIRRIALSFPGVEEGTSYGTPAFRVSRKFITRLHDEGEAMVMRVPFEEREMLMEREPETYFITGHYRDYPTVLALISACRLATSDAADEDVSVHDRWHRGAEI